VALTGPCDELTTPGETSVDAGGVVAVVLVGVCVLGGAVELVVAVFEEPPQPATARQMTPKRAVAEMRVMVDVLQSCSSSEFRRHLGVCSSIG
jgi:hypothetical protein